MLGAVLLLTIGSALVRAEEVEVVGQAGAPQLTLPGPGLEGLPGGDAESVLAVADAPGEDNTAIARGGVGGRGGNAGVRPQSQSIGAPGGPGGAGGDAEARAITRDAFLAQAEAYGGRGGRGGPGGFRVLNDPLQGPTGPEGPRGLPLAIADLEYTLAPVFGIREVVADAYAGAFGDSNGQPDGAAEAQSRAVVSTDGVVANSNATAVGGGFSDESRLVADAFALHTRGGSASAHAKTIGDFETGVERIAADSVSTAYAENVGVRGYASASSEIESGLRFEKNPPGHFLPEFTSNERISRGELRAEARVVGTGSFSASASSRTWAGPTVEAAPVVLSNLVSGSAQSRLILEQDGYSFGNDLASELVGVNEGGGDLLVRVEAVVLSHADVLPIGASRTRVGDTILGDVIGTSTTGGDVQVLVTARAAEGHGAMEAGRLRLESLSDPTGQTRSRIHGESNGGDVRVSTYLREANGATSRADSPLPTSGHSIDQRSVGTGVTSGELQLHQSIVAGSGGRANVDPNVLPTLALDRDWRGGNAYNEMVYHESVEMLTLTGHATGGSSGSVSNGLSGAQRLIYGADGGDGTLVIRGSNDAGGIRAFGGSTAGLCFSCTVNESLRSGRAAVDVEIRSIGDGAPVEVNVLDDNSFWIIRPRYFASGEGYATQSPETDAEIRYDASSRIVGIAEGDSEVTALSGSRVEFGFETPYRLLHSSAEGRGGGTSLVVADAYSEFGGSGFVSSNGDFIAGATSHAKATGLGQVEANSWAIGESMQREVFMGSAEATAEATGSSGFARARTTSARGFSAGVNDKLFPLVNATIEGAVSGSTSVRSVVRGDTGLTSAPGLLAGAFVGNVVVIGNPDEDTTARALAGNNGFRQEYEARPGSRMVAATQFEAMHTEAGQRTVEAVVDLSTASPVGTERVVVSVFEASYVGEGFSELHFSLEDDAGQELVAYTLGSIEEVTNILLSQFFDLGKLDTLGGNGSTFDFATLVTLRLRATVDEGDGIALGMAFAIIPEPSTGLLVLLGLAGFACRERRDRIPLS